MENDNDQAHINTNKTKKHVHSMVISQPSMAREERPGKEWEYGEMGAAEYSTEAETATQHPASFDGHSLSRAVCAHLYPT